MGPNQQFVANLVGSLAWPVGAFALAFLFKRPVGDLIEQIGSRVTRVKGAGVDVEFAETASLASRIAKSAVPEPAPEITLGPERADVTDGAGRLGGEDQRPQAQFDIDMLRERARINPRTAIETSWRAVKLAAEMSGSQYILPTDAAGDLAKKRVFPLELVAVVWDLALLQQQQNRRFSRAPSTAAAEDFVDAAWRLVAAFVSAGDTLAARSAGESNCGRGEPDVEGHASTE